MSPLTRREERIVRTYGRTGGEWLLTEMILTGTRLTAGRHYGTTAFVVDGVEHRMQTTSRGIVLDRPGPEVVTWTAIRAHIATLPTALVDALSEVSRARQKNMGAYPRFAASARAAGCGPFPEYGPYTPRQQAYVDELRAWEASGVLQAWKAERQALEAEQTQLLDQAFPLAVDDQPADLLELLQEAL